MTRMMLSQWILLNQLIMITQMMLTQWMMTQIVSNQWMMTQMLIDSVDNDDSG